MLRLVHPAPSGQDPPKRRKGSRSPALSLTADEARHLRAAIVNLARAYGSRGCLAAVLGVAPDVLTRQKRHPSAALALAVAKAAGMSVEAILGGDLSSMGRCPSCGSRVGDRPALALAGGAA
jgi:hypothetical protein